MDDEDRFRFVHDLFEFNDEERVKVYSDTYSDLRGRGDLGGRNIDFARSEKRERKLLVDIHAFVLMPNHYHLLLSERVENGISRFMQKVNAGYTKYFNCKNERVGVLLQGKYKSVSVDEEAHFIHLPYYIHLNPLDLTFPSWRERRLESSEDALRSLASYRWSSHLDYAGIQNFPSVTNREFLLEFFGGPEGYLEGISAWLKDMETQMENLAPVALEPLS